jgi:hypothetical protein
MFPRRARDEEAPLEVPSVEAEGDDVGSGRDEVFDNGGIRAIIGKTLVEDGPLGSREEAFRLGVGSQITRGQGDVGRRVAPIGFHDR